MKVKDKKILVLGCGGMLGQAVYHTFSENNIVLATDIDLNEDWLQYLDVRDTDALLAVCASFSPDIIINLAAITDLEYCEDHPEESFATNALGQENVCLVARQYDIPAVYISTAGVFDGSQELYSDSDRPNPQGTYGRSKYQAEIHTMKTLSRYFIFRAGWMMGGVGKDKKFVKKIFDQITDGIREINIVNDKSGSPTYTWDFARAMEQILATDHYDLYNMTCEGGGNRIDVATELIRNLHLSDFVRINSVTSSFFGDRYHAPRPLSEQLVNQKLKARNLMFMRDWRTCLMEYTRLLQASTKIVPHKST